MILLGSKTKVFMSEEVKLQIMIRITKVVVKEQRMQKLLDKL